MTGPGNLDIDEILAHLVELTPEAREAYLQESCAHDPLLLAEARSLLAAVDPSRGFLEVTESSAPVRSIGPYLLGPVIGAGGMGTVYAGDRADGEFQRRVAIKLLHSDLRSRDVLRRFHQEKRVLAQLDHPNIARLLDGGATEDGRPYLILEYVEGEPIDVYCDRRKLDVRERVALALQFVSALDHAHRQQIVHRDIKPANVLVAESGEVKLLDFGIAKVLSATDPRDETRTGLQRLTPRYASPEQILRGEITPASDVYSAGFLLYELLTGASPYDPSGVDLAEAVVHEEPVRPSTRARQAPLHVVLARKVATAAELADLLRGNLDHVLLQALAKEPPERYPTAAELAADLGRVLAEERVEARPLSLRSRARRALRRHPIASYLQAGQARRESETQRRTAETIAGLLEDVIASIDPRLAQGRDIELLRSVLDVTANRVRRELAPDTALAARLHTTIGTTYRAIGAYGPAERHLREALEAWQRSGTALGEVATGHLHLGMVLDDLSRHREAVALFRAGLHLARRIEPPDLAIETRLHHQLGRTLDTLEEDEEADAELGIAADSGARVFGPESLEVVEILVALASFYTTRDRLDRAESLSREAVARARSAGDPVTLALALAQQAFYHRWIRHYEPAEAGYREALAIREALCGRDHPLVAATYNDLAAVLEFRGQLDEAETLYRTGLEIDRRASGPRSLEVGSKINNIGGLLRKVGRLTEAQQCLEEALSIYIERLGPDHSWVTIARSNYVTVLLARGDYARAEAEARVVEASLQALFPDATWRLAILHSLLGEAVAGQGRREEAEVLLSSALAALESSLGPDDPRTREARERWNSFQRTIPS